MPVIDLVTLIEAPIAIVFDLARSIDAHRESQTAHNERAIARGGGTTAGRTSGLLEEGESVTWEATHFGIRQRLSSRIVTMSRPTHFRDSMVEGAFARFDHDHFFEAEREKSTRMRDVFDFDAPLGPLGRLANRLFLERYMRKLLEERNRVLKQLAEGGAKTDWG